MIYIKPTKLINKTVLNQKKNNFKRVKINKMIQKSSLNKINFSTIIQTLLKAKKQELMIIYKIK